MSVKIGDVTTAANRTDSKIGEVWCSRGGVELHIENAALRSIQLHSIDPVAARNFGALLERASDEVERMREHPE